MHSLSVRLGYSREHQLYLLHCHGNWCSARQQEDVSQNAELYLMLFAEQARSFPCWLFAANMWLYWIHLTAPTSSNNAVLKAISALKSFIVMSLLHIQQIDLWNTLQKRVYHLKTWNVFTVLITDYALISREIKGGVLVCVCIISPCVYPFQ